ncbi:hypothetical protein COY25_00810 [Candidatus Uhrbacteria bacterium CG_4_10_14_0_2_um_filter_41_7]|uniref:TspO protein n=1 Tax=Candidatus Uhrbacteria bacterium CG_4_9_14_3_um_filter_41_35 TaxID=1975034 RepID=A0A2M7XGD9_9BACT|nr:MAG: hypothetical protein COV92_03790 [Candidatus Uhrbacteria bacterium CG11_big_fil_rev_8_21_14_0_20_41_9]PIZ55555.1 MAG: hypothetical protein COY25_00810 [Candidatus Uhrbacteria bacterium CG_4_10_14_0_2_um_filter_41_7]PJA46796.1 MAG: hypothetical protein CO173_01050 [Candidatus Uhrbacteria bacterium CG_4_9_14_3_um_filter_41_35]
MKFFKISDIYIICGVVAVSLFGGVVTGSSMIWYDSLTLPSFTPDGSIIGTVWTLIFILSAISLSRVSRKVKSASDRQFIYLAFVVNGLFNVLWSVMFFGLHLLGPAIFEAGFLGLSVALIIGLLYKHDKIAAGLLVPYVSWVSFATFLTYSVWVLNN